MLHVRPLNVESVRKAIMIRVLSSIPVRYGRPMHNGVACPGSRA